MSRLFNDKSEESVFRKEELLLPEFIPEELPGREKELAEIAAALTPIAKGGKPSSLVIYGPTGTGKTSSAKYVLRELQEHTSKALCLYVNCWSFSSRQAVLSRVAQELGAFLPRRGLAGDEVQARIVELLKKEGKTLVLILDEADRLVAKGEERLLYDLSRADENWGVHCALIAITNDFEAIQSLDARIKSSLSHELEFPRYSPDQLKTILSERAKAAFMPKACPADVVASCAGHGARLNGDARIALETLWLAGRNADKRGARTGSLEDVKEAAHEKSVLRIKQALDSLSEGEKIVLDLVRAKPNITSGSLYAEFVKKNDETERSVRNYVTSLEQKKLLRTEMVGGGTEGRTKKIRLEDGVE